MSARSVLILAELAGDARSLLEADCARGDCQVTWLTSTEMLGAKLSSGRFDALVVHLQTPGAARACLEARKLLTRVHFPIIALSDELDETTHTKAFRVGADDVMHASDSAKISGRLAPVERAGYKNVARSRGEALIIDSESNRAESVARLLKDAGYFVKSVHDPAAAKLHFNRPSVRLVVTEAETGATAALIERGNKDEWHPLWIVRTRPSEVASISRELAMFENAAVVDVYSSASDVLYEANRLNARQDGELGKGLLYGSMVRVNTGVQNWKEHAFSYRVSAAGLSVRTLAQPPSDEVELELRDPHQGLLRRISGKVTRRRSFGPIVHEREPPGFSVELNEQSQAVWQEQIRAAYEQRFGRAMPPPERAPLSPRRDAASVGGTAIGRVKLVSSGALPVYAERPRRAAEESALDFKPVPVVSIDADARAAPPAVSLPEQVGRDAASHDEPPHAGQPSKQASDQPSGEAIAEPPAEAPHRSDDSTSTSAPALAAATEQTAPIPEPKGASLEQPHETLAESGNDTAAQNAGAPTKPRKRGRSGRSADLPRQSEPTSTDREPAIQNRKSSRAGLALAAAGAVAVIAAGASLARMQNREPRQARETTTRSAPPSDVQIASETTRVQALSSAARERSIVAPRTDRTPEATTRSSADAQDEPEAPSAIEPEQDPATLPGHLGYLYVTSSLDTQVFVQGRLAGKTNTLFETFCGRRYVRLGSAPGHWDSEGVTFRIECQSVNRLTLQPNSEHSP